MSLENVPSETSQTQEQLLCEPTNVSRIHKLLETQRRWAKVRRKAVLVGTEFMFQNCYTELGEDGGIVACHEYDLIVQTELTLKKRLQWQIIPSRLVNSDASVSTVKERKY